MVEDRNKLPIYSYKEELLGLVNKNNVIIVRGQTGSGKTTQVFSKKAVL